MTKQVYSTIYMGSCLIFLCLMPFLSQGQTSNFSPIKNPAEVKTKLKEKHQATHTIKSNFIQEKHLSFMKDKAVSKGTMMLKKEKKVRIEYTTPFNYLVIINGDKLYVRDGKKVTKINIGTDKSFSKLNDVLLQSLQGNFDESKDFSASYFENKDHYLLELTPINPGNDQLFKKINVFFGKESLQVEKLDMLEKSGDQTKMKFENTLINPTLPDEIFVAR